MQGEEVSPPPAQQSPLGCGRRLRWGLCVGLILFDIQVIAQDLRGGQGVAALFLLLMGVAAAGETRLGREAGEALVLVVDRLLRPLAETPPELPRPLRLRPLAVVHIQRKTHNDRVRVMLINRAHHRSDEVVAQRHIDHAQGGDDAGFVVTGGEARSFVAEIDGQVSQGCRELGVRS